jgi:hypothetical protein
VSSYQLLACLLFYHIQFLMWYAGTIKKEVKETFRKAVQNSTWKHEIFQLKREN